MARSQLARQLIINSTEWDRARAELDTLFAGGGALAWTATLYDVDAKSFFVMAFDQAGIRVFRFGEAAPQFTRRLSVPEFPGPEATALWRAWGGCLEGLRAEAFVPWSDIREIAAGNYVLWFRFNTPVTVTSDRDKKKSLKEFKVARQRRPLVRRTQGHRCRLVKHWPQRHGGTKANLLNAIRLPTG